MSTLSVVRQPAGRLSDLRGRAPVAATGLVVVAVALGITALGNSLASLIAAGIMDGLGHGITQPALIAWCVDGVAAGERGRAMGTFYTSSPPPAASRRRAESFRRGGSDPYGAGMVSVLSVQLPPRLSVNDGHFRPSSRQFEPGFASSPLETRRILIADDDRNHRRILEELLAEEGYEVDVASDGLEALAVIERTPPALLLLDLRMPKLDGVGVLERLRQRPRMFPVVVITAHQEADEDVIARGAVGVLIKPVSLDALLDAVQRFL